MTRADLVRADVDERMSPDDMATLREAQHLQAALLAQQARAEAGPRAVPGVCSTCGSVAQAAAVYCDDDCRADHQHRLDVRTRQMGRR